MGASSRHPALPAAVHAEMNTSVYNGAQAGFVKDVCCLKMVGNLKQLASADLTLARLNVSNEGTSGYEGVGGRQVPITIEHTKENYCAAHIYAICASAGVLMGKAHVQDYGVDGTFDTVIHRNNRRVVTGFPLDFQSKSTVNWEIKDGHVIYDLESKTYNDIVSRSPAETTLILILLCLPKSPFDWHIVTPTNTILQTCCFYHTFQGTPVENEKSKKRIRIPTSQVLTPDSLNQLLAAEKLRREKQAA